MNVFFITKLVAFISMFIDHIGCLFSLTSFRIIGRISMPLFALVMGVGTKKSSNLGIRTLKLLITALVSAPMAMYYFNTFEPNIIFSFFLFSLFFYLLKKYEINNTFVEIIGIITLAILAEIFTIDYGAYLILLTYAFYKIENVCGISLIFMLLTFCRIFVQSGFSKIYSLQSYALLALPLIMLFYLCKDTFCARKTYKSKFKNFLSKNLFYLLYPLHLLLLIILKEIIK